MKYIFLIIVFLFAIQTDSKEPDWMVKLRKIQILKSKRIDVERVFDSPKLVTSKVIGDLHKLGWRERVKYETKSGYLEVYYSTGTCLETDYEGDYDVEREIIVKMIFEPYKEVPLNKLNFNYDQFDATRVLDVVGAVDAGNKELGVSIYSINDKLRQIEFEPPASLNYLDCGKILEKKKS